MSTTTSHPNPPQPPPTDGSAGGPISGAAPASADGSAPGSAPTSADGPVPVAADGSAPASAPVPARRPRYVDPARPFGAHLRLAWWKPALLVPGLLLTMVVLQTALTMVVVVIEMLALGRSPEDVTLSPLLLAAVNASLAVTGVLAVLVTALVARVPWRSLIAHPRTWAWRRLAGYSGVFAVLVIAMLVVMALIDPASAGMGGSFAVTGTTIGLIAVAVLTTPLQAAGEELLYRGALMPLIGSWARAAKPALVLGMVGSSIVFGLSHLSIDPWLLSYYTVFGLSMAAMALLSRGLEAPIAFHVTNNVLMMVVGALFADGGGVVIDRSVGMGGPVMLVVMAADVAAVAVVGLYERRRRS